MPPSSGGGKEPSQITIGIKRALGGRITDRWLGSPGGARRGPFIGFFASAFKIAFFLGSLALLFVVIYFLLFNRELALGLLKGAGEKTFVWIQTVSPGFAEQLRTAYNVYFNPEEELARERGDEIKIVKEKSGIEITDAGADRKSYAGNEPVNVNFIFVGKNLAEDIKLKGTCELDTGGKEKYIVDEHITVIHTPGHDNRSISVLVKTTKGLVAITGDLFEYNKDWHTVDTSKAWEPWSQDKDLQMKSRKKIWNMAEYIVPGHGDIFKIDKSVEL